MGNKMARYRVEATKRAESGAVMILGACEIEADTIINAEIAADRWARAAINERQRPAGRASEYDHVGTPISQGYLDPVVSGRGDRQGCGVIATYRCDANPAISARNFIYLNLSLRSCLR